MIIYKVRKLLDILSPRFLSEYNTHEELSIDEAMIPFKGRLSIKQYMKDKPTKWGNKSFCFGRCKKWLYGTPSSIYWKKFPISKQ